jgi:hypothetical protein
MGRNIVICFDVVEDLGWSERRTSVLKLYYAMTRDETQRTYISGPNSTRTYDGADSILDVLKPVVQVELVEGDHATAEEPHE